MGTGVDTIAQTKIAGNSAWLVLVIGLVVFSALVISGMARRQKAGLNVPVMSGLVFPLVGGAAFGIIVVWILNSHQGIPLVTLIFAILLGIGGYVLKETT